jgi:hypothetical protein
MAQKTLYSKKEGLALLKKKSKPTPKRNRNFLEPSEHDIQVACVNWFREAYPRYQWLFLAIPNGAMLYGDKTRRAIQWKKLEAEGALPGAADLFLAVPSGELHGLWIEMKTPKGTQSEKQKKFGEHVKNVGYGYAMPKSVKEFIKVVESYLENGTY